MRRRPLARLAAIALAASAIALAPAPVPARAANPLLPDIQMARLADFRLQIFNGQRQLRFDAVVVNKGEGPLEVVGSRASTADPMTVAQRISEEGEGSSRVRRSGETVVDPG